MVGASRAWFRADGLFLCRSPLVISRAIFDVLVNISLGAQGLANSCSWMLELWSLTIYLLVCDGMGLLCL